MFIAYLNTNHNRALEEVKAGNKAEEEKLCDYKIFYDEQADGSRPSFTCEKSDGTPTSIQFSHPCSNAMKCLNIFRNSRMVRRRREERKTGKSFPIQYDMHIFC